MGNRPFLVTLVGGLNLVLGALVLIFAILLIFLGSVDIHNLGLDEQTVIDLEKALKDAGISWGGVMNVAAAFVAIFAIISMVIGYGMLRGWRIMWYVGIIFNGLSLVLALGSVITTLSSGASLVIGANVIGMIFNAVIIWYLLRPGVKEFFNI